MAVAVVVGLREGQTGSELATTLARPLGSGFMKHFSIFAKNQNWLHGNVFTFLIKKYILIRVKTISKQQINNCTFTVFRSNNNRIFLISAYNFKYVTVKPVVV